MAGGMNNTLRLLKKTLSGVGRICESTCVCAGTQALPCLPFHPSNEIPLVLMFVAFIGYVCKEIKKCITEPWCVGCGVAKDGGGTIWHRTGGGSRGRSHCPVILGHIFLGRTNLLNVRAFLLAFTCCFWVSRCTWIYGYISLPFCFCTPLPVVVWNADLSLLSGEHRGSVCEVLYHLWFCARPDGGREAYQIILQMRSWSPWRWSHLIRAV